MKKMVVVAVVFAFLNAKDLLSLLKNYEVAADLSQKTKIESLGHITVFTREDIELMQADYLIDILKTLKFHTLLPNKFGATQIAPGGTYPTVFTSYRLYIDDYEVSDPYSDNPYSLYDYYPLDAIDHIEIYTGSGAVRVGNSPSLMIIRLYTKKPKRENVSYFKTFVSNRNDRFFSVVEAKEKKNFSYLIALNRSKISQRKISPLRRDGDFYSAVAKIERKNDFAEFQYLQTNRNMFKGFSTNSNPQYAENKTKNLFLLYHRNFLEDNSLKLSLSYSFGEDNKLERNDNAIASTPFFVSNLLCPGNVDYATFYAIKRHLHNFRAYLTKEIELKNHTILTGLLVNEKRNYLERVKEKTICNTPLVFSPIKRNSIYSFVFEDQFLISDNQMIIASLKMDRHHRRKNYKDFSEQIGRVGYIATKNDFAFKTFYSNIYIPPSLFEMETASSVLKHEKIRGLSSELIYKSKYGKFNFLLAYLSIKNLIVLNPLGTQNDPERTVTKFYSFEYSKRILPNYKVDFSVYDVDIDSPTTYKKGASLRILGDFNKYSFFAEMLFKDGYRYESAEIKDSFDLDAGVSCRLKREVKIEFKAQNILNKAPVWMDIFNNNRIYKIGERKFFATLEYLF